MLLNLPMAIYSGFLTALICSKYSVFFFRQYQLISRPKGLVWGNITQTGNEGLDSVDIVGNIMNICYIMSTIEQEGVVWVSSYSRKFFFQKSLFHQFLPKLLFQISVVISL